MVYIVTGLVFITIGLFIGGLLTSIFMKERAISNLKYYKDVYKFEERNEISGHSKKAPGRSLITLLSNLVPRLSFTEKRRAKMAEELVKANILLKPEEIFVIRLLGATLSWFLIYVFLKDLIVASVTFVIVYNIPSVIIARKKSAKRKRFNQQINEGIMIISNSIKAGYSFLQAVSMVVKETEDPFSSEFNKLLKEMSLGVSMDEALRNILKRVESEDLELIINAILIQKDIGGNLSEILDNISSTIRERQKLDKEVKALTAQGKLSGYIVALLPVALGAGIYLLNKEYISILFTNKIGHVLLGGAVISQTIGIISINKITKIEM